MSPIVFWKVYVITDSGDILTYLIEYAEDSSFEHRKEYFISMYNDRMAQKFGNKVSKMENIDIDTALLNNMTGKDLQRACECGDSWEPNDTADKSEA